MKILMVSDWRGKGGAAIAAERLAEALEAQGHDVRWAFARTAHHHSGGCDLTRLPLSTEAAVRICGRLWSSASRQLQLSQMAAKLERLIRETSPDIVNVHNIHAANLSVSLPMQLSTVAPVVWTLHDMWAFTGGCTYSYDCTGFTRGCRCSCPQQIGHGKGQLKPELGCQKRHVALQRAGNIAFVTPSQWLATEAQRGLLAGRNVRAIANSVNLQRFRPVDRRTARAALGLPADMHAILTASASVVDPRKGVSVLMEALRLRPQRKLLWLTLGEGRAENVPSHVRHHPVGQIEDERLLSLAYSAADVHVLPTRADNLPNVLLEAAACGTPSIASHVGGVPEVVRADMTGWTVPVGDAPALANMLDHALDLNPDARESLRLRCRWFAHERFSPEHQAQHYVGLFQQLTEALGERSAA
ncbi:MAG: glycosyltransferase [Phycisphaeraceae bacterium]|nr:glycosyltransferase [Phycisphaeraceae bacterium]